MSDNAEQSTPSALPFNFLEREKYPMGKRPRRGMAKGRPPTLIYSLIRLHLDKIFALDWNDKRPARYIASQFGIAHTTYVAARRIITDSRISIKIERAYAESQTSASAAEKQALWDPVEDFIFANYPGFRDSDFYKSCLREILAGRLARRMAGKPGPKRKRDSSKSGVGEPTAPAAPSRGTAESLLPPPSETKDAARERRKALRAQVLAGSAQPPTPPAPTSE